ncbi:MAG: ATP-binding protein [Candidatus Sumerlaeia bacterium]|nr:ATP-binding protein [Candidatus Sumerlaeia bacterium]
MAKYSDETLEKLLQSIDAIDVLELIDYHPESMQRSGSVVTCWCPLSQDHSGRYLTVDVETREFVSEPPMMPRQSGTIIDLYARVRNLGLDTAVEELADEFGVLISEDGEGDPAQLLEDASGYVEEALKEKDEEKQKKQLEEAEKRIRAVLLSDGESLEAHRALLRVRLIEDNLFTLVPQVNEVIRLEGEKGDAKELTEVLAPYFKKHGKDLNIRLKYAEALAKLRATQQAVEEFMTTADLAEQAGQEELALRAYRSTQKIGDDIVDVHPMIVNLLMATGREKKAIEESEARIDFLKRKNRYLEASEETLRLLDLQPKDAATTCLRVIELAIMGGLGKEGMDRSLRMVEHLLEKGLTGQAAEALSYLIAEEPENDALLEKLIDTYDKLGEEDIAREFRFRLVDIYTAQGRKSDARRILGEVGSEEEETPRALRALGELAYSDGDVQEATTRWQRALDLHIREGDKDSAIADCMRILKADPDKHVIRKGLINLLLDQGDKTGALEQLDMLANRLTESGADEKAPEILESILERLPNNNAVKLALASAHERLGNIDRSQQLRMEILREEHRDSSETAEIEETAAFLLKKNPNDPTILHLVARKYERDGESAKAREAYEKLAEIHRKADRLQEARTAMERIAAMFPNEAAVFSELSEISAEMGDEAGLVRAARTQLDIHIANKDFSEALEPARTILDFLPSSEDVHYRLIDIYEALGRKQDALEQREQLRKLLVQNRDEIKELKLLGEITREKKNDEALRERQLQLIARHQDATRFEQALDGYTSDFKLDKEKRLKLLRDIADAVTERTEIRRFLAQELHKAGRTTEMVGEMQRLLALSDEKDDQDRSISILGELARLVPDRIEFRRDLANRLEKMNMKSEAIEQRLAIAWQLQKERKLTEADEEFRTMSRVDPENEEVYTSHADLLRDMGEEKQAAVRLCELSSLLSRKGDDERALTTLKKLLVFDAENGEARRQMIMIKARRGQTSEAVADLRSLIEQLRRDGDTQGALAATRDAIKMDEGNVELRELLLEQLGKAGREVEAVRERVALARLYSDKGKHRQGVQILDAIINDDPDNIQARSVRGAIYEAMGEQESAVADYRVVQESVQRISGSTPLPIANKSGRAVPADPIPTATAISEPGETLELLPEYEFDTFVVGKKNSFAFATAKAVAGRLGSERNPLFLYSDVGLGKTHLIHAIANHVRMSQPSLRIHYAIAVYFTNELEKAIASDTVGAFRERYKDADLLLLDDVQFLAGKEKSQEEFFHLFNILYQRKGQIVLTSDRPPKAIEELDKRLRSRFGQGVIVEIQPPDTDTRVKILEVERERTGVDFSDDVIEAIAEAITTNVRDLKGAFNQLIAINEIGGEPITPELATETISRYYMT